ncbi:MAG: hypothetical protein ACLR4Z_00895 [Butyricicoccaceae bacterium]
MTAIHRFFTTGWFLTIGGSLFEISDFVAALTVNDCPETAYISMNAEKIDRAVIDSGTETRTIEPTARSRSRSSCRGTAAA